MATLLLLGNLKQHKDSLVFEYRSPFLKQFGLKICIPEYYARTWRVWSGRPTQEEREEKPWKQLTTICDFCKNGCGGCSWSDGLIPVTGWKAVKTTIRRDPFAVMKSFQVFECPEFYPGRGRIKKGSDLDDDGCLRLLKAMLKDAEDDYILGSYHSRYMVEKWLVESQWFEDPQAIADKFHGIARTLDQHPSLIKDLARSDLMYDAIAYLKNGNTIKMSGTLQDCAYWADCIVRQNAGCKIDIKRIKKEKDDEHEAGSESGETPPGGSGKGTGGIENHVTKRRARHPGI